MKLKFMPAILILMILFLSATSAYSQTPTRGPAPAWTVLQTVPDKEAIDPSLLSGGFHYLLIDIQRNVPKEETFRHFCIKVTNSDAVQSSSDIDVNFDPTYQTLQFNMARLHRNGEVIDNLQNHEIKTFQRESGMDRNLYDGSITAVINQENVRIGDIIEYAYTSKGYNPIHQGNFFSSFQQQYTIPIQEYFFKIITSNNQPLNIQYRHDAVEPDVKKRNGLIEYSWEFSDIPAYSYPDNTPYWYNPLPEVQVSTYNQWAQVVNWALPHYQINPEDSAALLKLAPELTPASDKDEKILQAIRFVQDEVRYLGMEGGLGAYRPNQPYLVYQRRFGDCKDKSLLLSALLQNMGVDAYPVLVNTDLQERASEEIPYPFAFNHCIVRFSHKGRDVFVDPTISNQGGDLDHLDVLLYGKGLVIKDGITDLTSLPQPQPNTVVVDYFFTVEEIGGSVTLNITSAYRGMRADTQRDNFLTNSIETISLSSLDYYSNAYPGITEFKPLVFTDENRNGDNLFTVVESYLIEDGWMITRPDSSMVSFEITPLEMMEVADVPACAERTAPYATGPLLDLKVNMTMMMPEDWPVTPAKVNIQSDAFIYESEMSAKGKRVESNFRYQRLKKFIPADDTRAYIADHGRIWDDLFLGLTHDSDLEDFNFSWFVVALTLAIFALGLVGARNIHRNYDPAPKSFYPEPLPIGGWLYLAAFGAVIRPIFQFISLVSDPVYFDHNTWVAIIQDGGNSSFSGLGFMLGYEILYMTLSIAFALLVLVQFFQKRSSLPILTVWVLLGGLVLTAVDFLLGYILLEDGLMMAGLEEETSNIFGALLSTFIWVPYFLASTRVKMTFINRADGASPITVPEPLSEDPPHVHEAPQYTPPAPSRWPLVMILTAIILILVVLATVVVMFASGAYDLPPDIIPGSSEALGHRGGITALFLFIVAIPLIGLFSIFARQTWARNYNLSTIILSILAFFALVLTSYLGDPEPQTLELFLGFGFLSFPFVVTIALLVFNKAARNFPNENQENPAEGSEQWNYKNLCRDQVNELFQKIQEDSPSLQMDLQNEDPAQPISLTIPEQPGVPKRVLMDLQKNDVLNVSIGPAWMIWKSSNFNSVRNEFQITIKGILTGTYKYLEYWNKEDLRIARIQRIENNRWKEVRSWSKGRLNSTSKLREVLVEFGTQKDDVTNED